MKLGRTFNANLNVTTLSRERALEMEDRVRPTGVIILMVKLERRPENGGRGLKLSHGK